MDTPLEVGVAYKMVTSLMDRRLVVAAFADTAMRSRLNSAYWYCLNTCKTTVVILSFITMATL